MVAALRESGKSATVAAMKVTIRRSSAESAAQPVRVSALRPRRQVTGPRNAARAVGKSVSVTRNPGSEPALELPDGQRRAAAQPEAGADFAEVALQTQPIPVSGAQVDVGIGSRRVAVPIPVASGQGAEVQRSAAEAPEVAQSAGGGAGIEVLQHVVADDEVERRGAAVFLEPAVLPPIAAAEIGARLQTDVLGSRQQALERGAQEAGAAAGIEEPAHRQADVPGEGRYEARARLHFPTRRHRGARIVVVAPVVRLVERHRGLLERAHHSPLSDRPILAGNLIEAGQPGADFRQAPA